MDQRLIDLYDSFTHGFLNRRQFIEKASAILGTAGAAAALIPMLQCDYARAAIIDPNDARLANERIVYDTPKGKVTGYLSRSKNKQRRPAILIMHQNRGLNPHVEDVARRFAAEGFLALAPDLLSEFGGTPANQEDQIALYRKLDRSDARVGVASVSLLKKHPESTGKVGVIGFCAGGDMTNLVALNSPEVDAGVTYYGLAPRDLSKVKDLRAPLLLHFASLDKRVNATIAGWEEALKANKKPYTLYMYEGVNHAFSDDTAPERYNKAAADLAWGRTLAFFREHLGTPPSAT